MRIADLALRLLGSTSGEQVIRSAATASGAITLPAGTTDFTATGGAGQVVKQTTAGGAFTVAQLAASEVSGALTGNQTITLSGDITGSGATAIATTLPNVNPNVGVFVATTLNAKGQVTAGGALTGDVTTSGAAATIAAGAVSYAKIQNVANNRVLGNTSGSAAAPSEITLPLSAANGGTGLAAGTSGGIPYYSTTTTIASSALLTTNALIKGGGAGAAPIASAATVDGTGQLIAPVLSSTAAVNVGTDLSMGRIDQPMAYILRPNTVGLKQVGIAAGGDTTLDVVKINSLSTTLTGSLTVASPITPANGGTGQTTYTNGQLLIGNTTGNTLAKAALTAGTGIAVTNGAGSISVALAATASTSASAGAPAGTTSTAVPVMAGLNTTITPLTTGKVLIIISGMTGSNTAGGAVLLWGAYGTGTPPANGAAATGTAFPNYVYVTSPTANFTVPFSAQIIVSGAAIGTAMWIDLRQQASVSGGTLIQNPTVTACEI